VFSITISSPETSYIYYVRFPSPVYQYVIWLLVFPSGVVQVYLSMFRWGNSVLLTTKFFDVAKFTNLTPLSLLRQADTPRGNPSQKEKYRRRYDPERSNVKTHHDTKKRTAAEPPASNLPLRISQSPARTLHRANALRTGPSHLSTRIMPLRPTARCCLLPGPYNALAHCALTFQLPSRAGHTERDLTHRITANK
jgi:hypothetical protein